MSSNDLLSQDEIDALLHGVGLAELEPEVHHVTNSGGPPLYDFFSQDRMVPGRLRALDGISARLAESLQVRLEELLGVAVQVTAQDVQLQKFAECTQGLRAPSSLHLFTMQPLHGMALLVFDPVFAFRAVEFLSGGDGQQSCDRVRKSFMPAERRMMARTAACVLDEFARAWAPFITADIATVNADIGSYHEDLFSSAETVVTIGFEIHIPGGQGSMQWVIPYAMLTPILDRLAVPLSECLGQDDPVWREDLYESLRDAKVKVTGNLLQASTSLREIAQWRAGDVLPIAPSPQMVLRSGGISLFSGKFVIDAGYYAIKVIDRGANELESTLLREGVFDE